MTVDTGAPREYGSMTTLVVVILHKDVRVRLQAMADELTDCGFLRERAVVQ